MNHYKKNINRFFLLLCSGLIICSCKEPEARRPVTVKTGEFFKKSVERNKGLLEKEQNFIKALIQKDSVHTYYTSPNGYWYFYQTKDSTAAYTPQPDDVIHINYDIRYLNDSIIYSKEEIGEVRFKVDKEDLFPGLRTAVKLLKKGETATFMFPSSLAYGYHGDENRVGVNVPVKSTVTLIDILDIAKDSIQTGSNGTETAVGDTLQ
ncbi:gliding motility-associated peptidyl-prolyl isomerase GldI [Sinomicrobium kalidii]|uniref:gliding motility-associated peptidyl-prolyl isomerase GldI n=1 Tax=Sinomicrobium kalidii TaxID=2900738 RepID=UPI001E561D6F|nr:gliding motility-associated peptidyl-prolyl isomerase GldI [Sinomicrobium kalidii]UGU15507.1 gliding motility-associated peptidyl-prolyl isomerase GldI [Sinomicrobium kalidii]